METYRTEEEQVEALKRWWDDNGRSTMAAIVLALIAGFGWQGWKEFNQGQRVEASDLYQGLLQELSPRETASPDTAAARKIAGQIKSEFGASTYAQFAALHLARLGVNEGDLGGAESELRWVLAKADAGSDIAMVAQLRLARVLAAAGNTDQALAILAEGEGSVYAASYAMARGDVLLGLGRENEARAAYSEARSLAAADAGPPIATLEQKLQSLNPLPAAPVSTADKAAEPVPGDATADEG